MKQHILGQSPQQIPKAIKISQTYKWYAVLITTSNILNKYVWSSLDYLYTFDLCRSVAVGDRGTC